VQNAPPPRRDAPGCAADRPAVGQVFTPPLRQPA